MSPKAFSLKTDSSVREALERASHKSVSAEDLREQRVSFVFGSMSSTSSITRDQVRKVIEKQEVPGKE